MTRMLRMVLDCGNGACGVAALDLEEGGLAGFDSVGGAEAKAADRSALLALPRTPKRWRA
ncbi:MAG: hypothetical protein HYY23_13120 [Verrucomicrobia bacterium]|nr:hypothetical protein [Verrucomicrobiota bacterium]